MFLSRASIRFLPARHLRIVRVAVPVNRHYSLAMGNEQTSHDAPPVHREPPKPQVSFTQEELKARLSPEEYYVTQNKGTERAWSGRYLDVKEDGTFSCVVCANVLFKTDKKFDSGSGWPSFSDVASKSDSVVCIHDNTHGMVRTEVVCGKCSAHLGHVFNDGPKQSTGQRYCINGACLKFYTGDQLGEGSEVSPTHPDSAESANPKQDI